jgi:hypothetical protein
VVKVQHADVVMVVAKVQHVSVAQLVVVVVEEQELVRVFAVVLMLVGKQRIPQVE